MIELPYLHVSETSLLSLDICTIVSLVSDAYYMPLQTINEELTQTTILVAHTKCLILTQVS
jgi:hypothetical protein